jgi:hypothetical protein
MKIGPKAGPLFLNSLGAGRMTGYIHRVISTSKPIHQN